MSNYEDITPLPSQVLTTDEQIRAYVHPTRMTILAILARAKGSVSMVARQFKVHPANLTHHFKCLEKAGLIKKVETRDTGKNFEKLYRAVAFHFTVSVGNDLMTKKALALSILRDNLTAAVQSVGSTPADLPVMGIIKTVRLSPRDIGKFQKRLVSLAAEFERSDSKDGVVYSLNSSLYPSDAGDIPAQRITLQAD
jgi:DNA-binding transcriptional ArsR family regulator